ncbi:MAG: alanine--tRNA ligase, partial [Patescibacteria group bacterium]
KFAGGLADHSEQTVRGHTATHLMHQAIRDMLDTSVHQSGSNITSERVRFDFNFDRNLTDEEIKKLEETVNEKIKAKMPVYFEFMPLEKAKEIGAIGLFDEKYSDKVKIYLIGDKNPEKAYSKEFCGGPHVNFTQEVKSFKIIKQENIGNGLRRLYAKVG